MDKKTAKSKLAKLCSIKELCRYDAIEKLHKWEIFNEAEDIVDWLEDEKFIDQGRYARFYVRDKYRFNKWGRIKISYHLKYKNIAEQDISEALKEINEKEYNDILFSLISQKYKSLKDEDPLQKKSKLYRFAQSRGFESDLIFKQIEAII